LNYNSSEDNPEEIFGVLERAIIKIDNENIFTVYPKDRNIIETEVLLKNYHEVKNEINVQVTGITSLGL
jgi:hypothetical protein